MVLSKCYGLAKYGLVCVNVIFCAKGLAAIILAIWLLTGQTFLVPLAQEEHNFNTGLYILLAAGILMTIISLLGCCGAFRESQCMLVGFFSCLLVIVVGQIATGVWLWTNSNRLEELVENSMINTVKNKYGVESAYTETLDTFQSELRCCGATGPEDWIGSKYATKDPTAPVAMTVSSDANSVYKLPQSCCKDKDSEACKMAGEIKVASKIDRFIYTEGCIDKLMDEINNHKYYIIDVFIGVHVLELLGLIFALILCCAIRSSDRYKA